MNSPSWFDLTGDVIIGGLRLCGSTLDWSFNCNIGGPSSGPTYCQTFPDSTCQFQPSQVFSSFGCRTTTQDLWGAGCPAGSPLNFNVDYKFRQGFMTPDIHVNASVIATIGCDTVVMEDSGSGLVVSIKDTPNCGTSSSSSSSSSSSTPPPSSSTIITVLTSTVTSCSTYTITSCPPSVKTCHIGSLTTETLTSFTIYSPTTTPTTVYTTLAPSSTKSTSSVIVTPSSSSKSTSLTAPTSTPTAPLQASDGSLLSVPRIFGWYSAMLPFFSLPSVLGYFDANPVDYHHQVRDIQSQISKRFPPVADFNDIKAFRALLDGAMEVNLPTTPAQSPSLLVGKFVSTTTDMCTSGKSNLAKYGAKWTATPKVLAQMLADCVTSMDAVEKDLSKFYTQAELTSGPQGVLFLKFAGAMYCSRLVATLVNDAAALDQICTL